jgi:hypothetical protein
MLAPAFEAREVQYRDALEELNKSQNPKANTQDLSTSTDHSTSTDRDSDAKKRRPFQTFSFRLPNHKQEDPAWWNRRLPPLQSPAAPIPSPRPPATPFAHPITPLSSPWQPVTLTGAIRLGHPIPLE